MEKVVDTELRVKGLRVAGARILLMAVCEHYQVARYAMAEKAADLI